MALVTFSGFPCSGKSTRATELAKYFEARLSATESSIALKRTKVVVLSDESLHLSKSAYDDSQSEKPARAALFSAVIRYLNKETIVIVDGMNYIKGSRYQMYLAAREMEVRICTVYIATPPEKCIEWNSQLDTSISYSQPTIENLLTRFEEPSSQVRWDSPLFTIPYLDPPFNSIDNITKEFNNPESSRIYDAITSGIVKPANVATLVVPTSSPTYLTLLESSTSLLLKTIMSTQTLHSAPLSHTTISIPTSPPIKLEISLGKMLSVPMGERMKKQFTRLTMQAQGTGGGGLRGQELSKETIVGLFRDYLEGAVR